MKSTKLRAKMQIINLLVHGFFENCGMVFSPFVFVTKPRTDLCMTCQQNISFVMRTQNCEDIDKKSNSILRHLEHLDLAQKQRMDYQQRSYYQKKLLERFLI